MINHEAYFWRYSNRKPYRCKQSSEAKAKEQKMITAATEEVRVYRGHRAWCVPIRCDRRAPRKCARITNRCYPFLRRSSVEETARRYLPLPVPPITPLRVVMDPIWDISKDTPLIYISSGTSVTGVLLVLPLQVIQHRPLSTEIHKSVPDRRKAIHR